MSGCYLSLRVFSSYKTSRRRRSSGTGLYVCGKRSYSEGPCGHVRNEKKPARFPEAPEGPRTGSELPQELEWRCGRSGRAPCGHVQKGAGCEMRRQRVSHLHRTTSAIAGTGTSARGQARCIFRVCRPDKKLALYYYYQASFTHLGNWTLCLHSIMSAQTRAVQPNRLHEYSLRARACIDPTHGRRQRQGAGWDRRQEHSTVGGWPGASGRGEEAEAAAFVRPVCDSHSRETRGAGGQPPDQGAAGGGMPTGGRQPQCAARPAL